MTEGLIQSLFVVLEVVLTALMGQLAWALRKRKKLADEEQARAQLLAKAAMLNLRMNIMRECNRYIERGVAPIYAVRTVEEMYEVYHALGGNGGIEALIADFRNLPHAAVKC